MLDLTRLSYDEPYEPDEYILFESMNTLDGHVFKEAFYRFKGEAKDLGLNVLNHSVNFNTESCEDTGKYIGDFYVVCESHIMDLPPQLEIAEAVRQWRFRGMFNIFYLTRYTFKDFADIVSVTRHRKHWLHFVITNDPEQFPSADPFKTYLS